MYYIKFNNNSVIVNNYISYSRCTKQFLRNFLSKSAQSKSGEELNNELLKVFAEHTENITSSQVCYSEVNIYLSDKNI